MHSFFQNLQRVQLHSNGAGVPPKLRKGRMRNRRMHKIFHIPSLPGRAPRGLFLQSRRARPGAVQLSEFLIAR